MTRVPEEPGPCDGELLSGYVSGDRPDAFAELVRRHIDLVYSAARSVLRDRQLAEDVTQNVFLLLARKAHSLTGRRDLAGWLYQTATLDARSVLRKRVRENRRVEQLAHQLPDEKDSMRSQEWKEIEPHLSEAMDSLQENEREAILMRYFQRRPYERIAAALGVSEPAARQRVHRALERLREALGRRGVVAAPAVLGVAMKLHAVGPAPAGLEARAVEAAATAIKGAGANLVPIHSQILAALIVGTTAVTAAGVALVVSLHRGGSESLYVDAGPGAASAKVEQRPLQRRVRPPFQVIRAVSYDDHHGTRAVAGFIGYIGPGDWLRFNKVDLGPPEQQPATLSVTLDCPDQYAGNTIEIHCDSLGGPVLGRLKVESTGGYGKWRQVATRLSGAVGVHDLFLTFSGGGWNLDTFKVTLRRRTATMPIQAVSYNEGYHVESRGGVVCETSDGSWVRYNGTEFDTNVNALAITYACGNVSAGGVIEIRSERPDGPIVGEIDVQNTGGWGSFRAALVPISGLTGTHDIVLRFSGKTHGIADVQGFQFLHVDSAPATHPTTRPSGQVALNAGARKAP